MKRGKQVPSRTKRQQKKRRWWRYLDLVLIVVLLNVLGLAARSLPVIRTVVTTASAMAHQTPMVGSYTGLNAIVVPLEKIVAQVQQQPQLDCSDPGLSQADLQKCLEGNNSANTYSDKKPKIQNPISEGSALFFFTPPDITVDNSSVKTLWGFVMGVVDILLVIVLMLNGFRIILTGSVFRYSRVIEELPGVLLALVVAHISLTFITVIIGVNNTMTSTMYTFAENSPNIQRSHSGFGDGKKKDYLLRVYFPFLAGSASGENYWENVVTMPSPFEAKDLYPGPTHTYPDGPGPTNEDISHFKREWVCTPKEVNFDRYDREALFGTQAGNDTPLYQNIKDRSEYIIKNLDTKKAPAGEKEKLQKMPEQIAEDLTNFYTKRMDWYNHLEQFSKEMDIDENKYLPAGSPRSYRDDTDHLVSAASLLFNGGGRATPVQGSGQAGDAIIYSCEDDATGSNFQLVPDDLNFTDLFKELQDLTNILKTVTKLLALMLLGQMVIRLFFINFYIVVAPLGIACWALPGKVGQPVTRTWLQGLVSLVLVQFVMAVAVIVTQLLLGEIISFTGGGDPQHVAGGLNSGTLADIVHIACLWFVFRIPSLLQSAPLRSMSEAGQMMSQAVGMTIMMNLTQIQMETQIGMMGVQGGMGAFGGGMSRGMMGMQGGMGAFGGRGMGRGIGGLRGIGMFRGIGR